MNKKTIIIVSIILIITFLTGIILFIKPFESKEYKLFNSTVKECLESTNLNNYIKKNDTTIKYVNDSYISKYDDFEYYNSFYDSINNEIIIKYNEDKEYMKTEIYCALGSMIYNNFNSSEKNDFTKIFDKRFNFIANYEIHKNVKIDSYFYICYSTTFTTMYYIYTQDKNWMKNNYKDIYEYFNNIEKEIL